MRWSRLYRSIEQMPSDRDAGDSVDEFEAHMEAFREHMDRFWETMAEYEELIESSDLAAPAETRETDAPTADSSDVEIPTAAQPDPDVTDSTWIASDTTVSLDAWR